MIRFIYSCAESYPQSMNLMHGEHHGSGGRTIIGGVGRDTLQGAAGDDNLQGALNDDLVHGGLGGHDLLYGGAGNDHLIATGMGGLIGGGVGNDVIEATKIKFGQYHIFGGVGDDRVIMDMTNKVGWGHQGHHVYGGAGSDSFVFRNVGATQADMLGRIDDFNSSRDSLWNGTQKIDLHDLPANMRVVMYNGQQWLHINSDTSLGNSDPTKGDVLYALDGARQVSGVEETHFTAFPADVDKLPTVIFNGENYVDFELYRAREASLKTMVSTATELNGTARADYITCVKSMNKLVGSHNTIIGFGGDDVVDAGLGHDLVRGGDGNDILGGGLDNDTLYGDAGSDLLFGGSQNDMLSGGDGNDSLSGGTGSDGLYGGTGNDRLNGDVGSDRLAGSDGADVLLGGAGADLLVGGAGADRIIGGAGIDTAAYSSATGVIVALDGSLSGSHEAAGDVLLEVENLYGTGSSDRLRGDAVANVLNGGGGNDLLEGQAGDDLLYGDAGNDVLYGSTGNDVMIGGAGTDRLDGGAGIDRAQYSQAATGVVVDLVSAVHAGEALGDVILGVEHLYGSAHADTLRADGGANALWGWMGNDTLYAREGNDALFGGAGSDMLYGGLGADGFVFLKGNDRDQVNDFQNDVDTIHFRGLGLTSTAQALSRATANGGDVVFDFGDGDVMVVRNATIAALQDDISIL